MRIVKVDRKTTGLIHISCSCRFHHTTDNGHECQRITDKHVRFHKEKDQEITVENYLDGVLAKPKSHPIHFHSASSIRQAQLL